MGSAVAIMAMVAVILLCWLLFWPTNFSLPRQLIIQFDPCHTLFVFFLCNILLLAITFGTHFWELPRNSDGVTAYKFSARETGQNHHVTVSADSFCEQKTPKSEYGEPNNQKNFICTHEYAGDKCLCSSLSLSVPLELMQLLELPRIWTAQSTMNWPP